MQSPKFNEYDVNQLAGASVLAEMRNVSEPERAALPYADPARIEREQLKKWRPTSKKLERARG